MEESLKISFSGSIIPLLFIHLLFLSFLGVLMDMFQTPFLPEPSALEDSEEQFEAFCRKSGVCSFIFPVHEIPFFISH